MNLLTNRMLANVPRAMTASFPLRDPYELNSRGTSLEEKCDSVMIAVYSFTEALTGLMRVLAIIQNSALFPSTLRMKFPNLGQENRVIL